MKSLKDNIGVIEKFLGIAEKYKFSTILKSICIMVIFALTIFFINNPSYIFDKYEQIKEERHKEQMELVMKNNVIIQHEIDELLDKTDADRVLLLQYHNTKNSLSGIPFIYLTATHETLTFNTAPVSHGYETMKTSLYPFISYIAKYKYFCGDISELEKYDKALAYRMKGNDVTHFAMCHIDCDVPLGVIVVTYTDTINDSHECPQVEQLIRNSAMKIGMLINNK